MSIMSSLFRGGGLSRRWYGSGLLRRALSSSGRESMNYDVVIVGAGPAGLAAAIRLKQLSSELSVCVLEKGSEVGSHIVSGNVLEPRALDELLPDWREDETCPIETAVTSDFFYFLTESSGIPLPTPPVLDNHGNYVTSLSRVVRWLATKAEELDVEIYPGFAAAEVLYEDEDGTSPRVVGVATRDAGIDKDGTEKDTFERGVELIADKHVFFAEGARGSCSESVIEKFGIRPNHQVYGLGVKEVWKVPDAQPGLVQHTIGWPLDSRTYGGSFLYHMSPDLIQVGFVVGLDYQNPNLSPYKEFQRFKHHPQIKKHLQNGECVQYGARVINEGGFQSIPSKLGVNGASLIGCSAGFVNVPKIKGTHTAMKSATLAAEALVNGTDYDADLRASWVYDELRAVRNYKPSFDIGGLYGGALYSAASAYVLRGKEPWTLGGQHAKDSETTKSQGKIIDYPKPDGALSFSLLDNLARAGVDHADQPSHLKVKEHLRDRILGESESLKTHGAPERNFCPAGVYEYVDEKLVINNQNCVHCKCCAIKMPLDYIDWTVPEGGGGPNYTLT